MLEKSLGLLFFLKQPKNQCDERYVYLRITVDGISKEFSTKRIWYQSRWDQNCGKAKGTKEDALKLNAYLDVLRMKVHDARNKLLQDDRLITAQTLKNFVTGGGEEKNMLLAIFQKHNDEIFQLIGKDYKYRTYQRYRTTLDHTKAFIVWKYGIDDMELKQLDYAFAKDFSLWLKTIKNCNHNSAMKYISTLKSVLLECKSRKLISDNPFSDFKMAMKEVEIVPLQASELSAIQKKQFEIDRLDLVRDIFVFSCFTGLAYVDVGNLTVNHIVKLDGEKWILTKREKTGTVQRIPLLKPALEIIEKYRNHPKCIEKNKVLPILTNQKMNAYLKEIADVCGVKKKLTFHIARHTFATTVTLSNGVPIETVSSLLGHKKLTQTQHYAKIVDLKISEDMSKLKVKLGF